MSVLLTWNSEKERLLQKFFQEAEDKGQLILKRIFGVFNSPKKTNKIIGLYYYGIVHQVELFSLVFCGKDTKKIF